MANEELTRQGYLSSGELRGSAYGQFEKLDIGDTSIGELIACGLKCQITETVPFPFKRYKPPKSPKAAKPDRVILDRRKGESIPVASVEYKQPAQFNSEDKRLAAMEQALFAASVLGLRLAVATDDESFKYVNVDETLRTGSLILYSEHRQLTPGVLEDLLTVEASRRDPTQLAQTVWQLIWQATKEEPKTCLLTFVELFMLKYLSDNLPANQLPRAKSFYELTKYSLAEFEATHGKKAIDYYVTVIRPEIKKLFPEDTFAGEPEVAQLFGMKTVVSKASLINGFAFLRSSRESISSFNRTFLEILQAFESFGSLTNIDPEFKLRLYETFLKNSPSQQSLGQFFTPRNVVREMISMADLGSLPDNSVVLDPAAGVGGFVLEPLLLEDSLQDNVTIESGQPKRRIKTIGVDMDVSTHILAKANMLLHLSDLLTKPSTTLRALNKAMANTFVLMNANETLGSLENPPREAVDVVLANPPYVTQGSSIYRNEIRSLEGLRNGVDLRDYYEGWGLGVESLFLRYISGALKPGRRAFIIVPLGMLNRTDPKPKQKLLDECNILASINLPRNTFFNTSQATCILVIEKRHTAEDPRPDVMCAYVRTIGETLDAYRSPDPDNNDLRTVSEFFLQRDSDASLIPYEGFIKIISHSEFSATARWDVVRFWTDAELVKLGVKPAPIGRGQFIAETIAEIQEVADELKQSEIDFKSLTGTHNKTVSLSNPFLFVIRSGTRVTNSEIRNNPGAVPVYSCTRFRHKAKGDISEDYLKAKRIRIEDTNQAIITIAANGSVGEVFVRRERCMITDDLIAVEVLDPAIDPEYLAVELRRNIAEKGYCYEAKLFKGRVETLTAEIPIDSAGEFDTEKQKEIASAQVRLDTIREKLSDIGKRSDTARIN